MSDKNKASEIEIVVGKTVIKTISDELIEVNETPDGVAFNLKGGLSILFVDPYMPSSAKQIVKNTADRMRGKKLVFNLQDPKMPAMVQG